MYKTKNDLSEATRVKVIELLNARLADCKDLETQTKQAHWNVKGPHFIGLHLLFDNVYDDVRNYVDEIAERAVQLGGIAEGTARVVAKRSSLPEYPLHAADGHSHVDASIDGSRPRSASRRARRSTRPASWVTRTRPTCSPRYRGASTSGSGSSRRTCKPIAEPGRDDRLKSTGSCGASGRSTMKVGLPSGAGSQQKHRLDPARIIETAENLAREVGEKLPGSSLAGLAVELAQIAHETDERTLRARRPIYAIRVISLLAVSVSLLALWYLLGHIHTRWEFGTITEVFEAADAGFNLLILLAGALWFLITIENRIKRRKALLFIEELREFIHVIDVTQLYYTPAVYNPDHETTRTSVSFDYTYFLFCTQMLAIISNLAPLYSRGTTGDSILRSLGGRSACQRHHCEAALQGGIGSSGVGKRLRRP